MTDHSAADGVDPVADVSQQATDLCPGAAYPRDVVPAQRRPVSGEDVRRTEARHTAVAALLREADGADQRAERRDRAAERRDDLAASRRTLTPQQSYVAAATDRASSAIDRVHSGRDRDRAAGHRAELLGVDAPAELTSEAVLADQALPAAAPGPLSAGHDRRGACGDRRQDAGDRRQATDRRDSDDPT